MLPGLVKFKFFQSDHEGEGRKEIDINVTQEEITQEEPKAEKKDADADGDAKMEEKTDGVGAENNGADKTEEKKESDLDVPRASVQESKEGGGLPKLDSSIIDIHCKGLGFLGRSVYLKCNVGKVGDLAFDDKKCIEAVKQVITSKVNEMNTDRKKFDPDMDTTTIEVVRAMANSEEFAQNQPLDACTVGDH